MFEHQLSRAAVEWLAHGDRGTSSETIFSRTTSVAATLYESTPSDPDDLDRCRKLLEQVPECRDNFQRMREVSPVWAKLVDGWAELCAQMDAEAPQWRKGHGAAPDTYAVMQSLGC